MLSHKLLLPVVLAVFLFAGCKNYYLVSDFDSRTGDHKTFAVLPFEMVFTGKKPEKLTDEDMERIGDAESRAFMISFYDEVLRSTHGGRKPIRVGVQHYDKTLSILDANNISLRAAWKEDPSELAKLLGVDAVIKGRIEKHRLMSDFASYGIDLGIHIVSLITDNWYLFPSGITKSKDIKTSYSLVDSDGTVLWSIAYDMDADWRQPANEVIEYINRKSVKHFPYRVR